jgi:hypothetical protein
VSSGRVRAFSRQRRKRDKSKSFDRQEEEEEDEDEGGGRRDDDEDDEDEEEDGDEDDDEDDDEDEGRSKGWLGASGGKMLLQQLKQLRPPTTWPLGGASTQEKKDEDEGVLEGEFNINGFTRLLAEGEAFAGFNGPRPNCLEVHVVAARGLKAMDINRLSGRRSSDPKVKISCRWEQKKTHTVMKNLNPMWNQKFQFHCSDPSCVLHLRVLDEDVSKDQLIGQWMMTTKYLFMDPSSCVHADGTHFKYTRHGKDANGSIIYPSIQVGSCNMRTMLIHYAHTPCSYTMAHTPCAHTMLIHHAPCTPYTTYTTGLVPIDRRQFQAG